MEISKNQSSQYSSYFFSFLLYLSFRVTIIQTRKPFDRMLQSWTNSLVWCPFLIPLFAFLQIITGSYHERRLYDDLMKNYNNLERPVQNHSQPVVVSFCLQNFKNIRTTLLVHCFSVLKAYFVNKYYISLIILIIYAKLNAKFFLLVFFNLHELFICLMY